VPGLGDAVQIVAGGNHACARRVSGAVVCWGSNESGETGDGTAGGSRVVPVMVVSGLSDAVEIAAGWQQTCARRTSGAVVCWGSNTNGQLGDGTTSARSAPIPVGDLAASTLLAAGGSHTCARRDTGALACWGWNFYGQLGDGTTTQRLMPVAVLPPPP
jgi:alpha-tubulin suppressor-like RCC1 family protein